MKKHEDINQKDFESIEAFLLGKLNEQERKAFIDKMESDPVLTTEVDTQREMMLAVETAEMKKKLGVIHNKTSQKSSGTKWYLMAASILILVSVGIWLVNRPSVTDRIFKEYMLAEHGLPTPMSATDNYVFYDAMVDFKSEKYDRAIKKWEPLYSENPKNDTLNYFMGVASFNNENFDNAIIYLEALKENENSVFLDKGEMYLALSFLKTGQIEALQKLANQSNSAYSDQLKEIKQKLE